MHVKIVLMQTVIYHKIRPDSNVKTLRKLFNETNGKSEIISKIGMNKSA